MAESAESDDSASRSPSPSHALNPLAPLHSIQQTYHLLGACDRVETEETPCSWSSQTSRKSDEETESWLDTPVSLRAGDRRMRRSFHESSGAHEADVEASVQEALRLLQDSAETESEDEHETERWRAANEAGGEARREKWRFLPHSADIKSEDEHETELSRRERTNAGRLDFVQDVMETTWTVESRNGFLAPEGRTIEREQEVEKGECLKEEQRDETNHPEKKKQDSRKEETLETEWQEAYTAKGRVYYYNRRTRESSWKMPSQVSASSREPQPDAAATKDEAESHSSMLSQSLGSHPCASASTPAMATMERQTTLFCCFCGTQQSCDRFALHFQECTTAKFHKRQVSPLYLSFERALGLLSEDTTLRSVHYASSFPDPTPPWRPNASSIQDSLSLLHSRRRRSSIKTKLSTSKITLEERFSICNRPAGTTDNGTTSSLDPRRDESIQSASAGEARKNGKANPSEQNDEKKRNSRSTSNVSVQAPAMQQMEMCRYCRRSFAEGRLAKHEAVCPRVFGTEGSRRRGRPASNHPMSPRHPRAPRSHKVKDHTLQQSFHAHQATLVVCPCCHRKFAPSGAQQHIAICKEVQHRPKNPVPLRRAYAIAG
ncbi:hypothetical protein PsorP6_014318 [Peronosclerospora sorghi]|uniref:Uncharacterized protein n=1 Tax=Peronosclerospora sorghi TaxID=230839 RepID=A0ACC0VIN4_9STRA|nr:hypothetical protein PsorP6_014318 [Peronosclerospora sorghi]